jgi:hypothetical protein
MCFLQKSDHRALHDTIIIVLARKLDVTTQRMRWETQASARAPQFLNGSCTPSRNLLYKGFSAVDTALQVVSMHALAKSACATIHKLA